MRDDDRIVCLNCAREPNVPEPLPWVKRDALAPIKALSFLTDTERAARKSKATYMRQRRWRESHLVSKKA